jgi:hypothetical protein
MILLGILCLIISSYSVIADWHSSSFGGSVTVEEPPSYTWHNTSFGGSVEVLDIPINTSIAPTTWIAGSNTVSTSVQENFTFWQNGSSNLDITIGINTTNFSFVNYTTWESSGYNQVCANFTTDSWSSETNIADTSYPFSTVLQSNFAPGNFNFGVRIWMPKTLDAENVDENFELIISSSEHT